MMLLEMLRKLIAYHLWGHDRALQMIETAGRPVDAVELIAHTLAADDLWMKRIEFGGQPEFTVPKDLNEAKELMFAVQSKWHKLLDRLSDEMLASKVTYRNIKGAEYRQPVSEILLHVINHGTYHRGQIARIVRKSGGEPIPTDLAIFFRKG